MKPTHHPIQADPHTIDESSDSTLTIMPDGRIFAFGITRPLVDVLSTFTAADEETARLLRRIGGMNGPSAPTTTKREGSRHDLKPFEEPC